MTMGSGENWHPLHVEEMVKTFLEVEEIIEETKPSKKRKKKSLATPTAGR